MAIGFEHSTENELLAAIDAGHARADARLVELGINAHGAPWGDEVTFPAGAVELLAREGSAATGRMIDAEKAHTPIAAVIQELESAPWDRGPTRRAIERSIESTLALTESPTMRRLYDAVDEERARRVTGAGEQVALKADLAQARQAAGLDPASGRSTTRTEIPERVRQAAARFERPGNTGPDPEIEATIGRVQGRGVGR